jgi:hypothetical protein
MYIEIGPNRTSPPAILLRESFRDGDQIRKRTLANLSQWEPARVEALRRALRGEFDHLTGGDPICGPVFGVLYALKHVADDLGIPSVLGRTRTGKLGLFLTLARVAHQGSRLSAVRWAQQHAVREVLGVGGFDEDDLSRTLDTVARRQDHVEQALYRRYVHRPGRQPVVFLYDVTSSYLEGDKNELGAYGYNRDGKKGKRQIVVGLLTDAAGEPFAVRVFDGNTADPSTVPTPIAILKQRFHVAEVVFVGDRGMVKAKGKALLAAERLRYLTALTEPQIRTLVKRGVVQLGQFAEQVTEVQAAGRRYILRKNATEARKAWHRLQDKLHTLQLAGCYVLETDVSPALLDTHTAHDRYKDLAHVEHDFRTMKTGLLEVRPIFVRKESRTRGHVFVCLLALKLSRELQRRLAAAFGTTQDEPHGVTVPDAVAALNRLCLLTYPFDDTHSVTRLPRPDAQQTRILQALQVPLPSRGQCRQEHRSPEIATNH